MLIVNAALSVLGDYKLHGLVEPSIAAIVLARAAVQHLMSCAHSPRHRLAAATCATLASTLRILVMIIILITMIAVALQMRLFVVVVVVVTITAAAVIAAYAAYARVMAVVCVVAVRENATI